MANKPRPKSSQPGLPDGKAAVCQEYRLDLVDFATGGRNNLTRERQKELIQHLNKCQTCQEAFLDYENIYATSVAAEHTRSPAFQKKISEVISRLKSGESRGVQLDLDQNKLGESAGKLHRLLVRNGPVRIEDLPPVSQLPSSLAYGAMGWLARENKLHFPKEGNTTYVTLTPLEMEKYQPGA